jgi:hypothetical protein
VFAIILIVNNRFDTFEALPEDGLIVETMAACPIGIGAPRDICVCQVRAIGPDFFID